MPAPTMPPINCAKMYAGTFFHGKSRNVASAIVTYEDIKNGMQSARYGMIMR